MGGGKLCNVECVSKLLLFGEGGGERSGVVMDKLNCGFNGELMMLAEEEGSLAGCPYVVFFFFLT